MLQMLKLKKTLILLQHIFYFIAQVFSTIDSSIDTHWTDLTDSQPDRLLLLIEFVLVFSSRLSAVT